ncbi:MAG TPA: hypothetical protein VFB39_16825 [Solirubrobacteraceae bacterium]|nr:hypothetical protein [Solirubrobacteraceae bacterium]
MPVLRPAWQLEAMHKRTVVVPLTVLAAAAGLAGGAFADSQSDSHPPKASGCGSERAIISDAARRLHVTPTRLTDALRQAAIDQINAAVAAGHLTRAQAKAIKRQIEQSPGLVFGPGVLAPEIKAAAAIAPPGWPPHGVSKGKHTQRALNQALSTRHIHGIVSSSGPPGSISPPGRVRIQVRAGGPSACFGFAGPAPLPLLRTPIAPPKP